MFSSGSKSQGITLSRGSEGSVNQLGRVSRALCDVTKSTSLIQLCVFVCSFLHRGSIKRTKGFSLVLQCLPGRHSRVKRVLVLGNSVLSPSVSHLLRLDAGAWRRILGGGGEPLAPLLRLWLVVMAAVVRQPAEGHQRLHHADAALDRGVLQDFAVPAAHGPAPGGTALVPPAVCSLVVGEAGPASVTKVEQTPPTWQASVSLKPLFLHFQVDSATATLQPLKSTHCSSLFPCSPPPFFKGMSGQTVTQEEQTMILFRCDFLPPAALQLTVQQRQKTQ